MGSVFSRGVLRGAIAALLGACAPSKPAVPGFAVTDDGQGLATELAKALVEACPAAPSGDLSAKEACASKLSKLPILRDHMAEPFLWGPQREPTSYDFTGGKTTRFNPFVWRRMYLALETFTGAYTIELRGGRTVLRMATRFRNELDPGEYPYPFWHSTAKWESYQFSVETLFLIEDGKIAGALRSARQDRNRLANTRSFDGHWDSASDQGGPNVALYRRLFSPSNPHVPSLDAAYRAFEAESRPYQCTGCHRPDNPANQAELEMFCYPNQALASRHTLVRAIETKLMPPPAAPGAGSGIDDEHKRERLLHLARSFETAAESALSFEADRAR